jgi:hypothetical protein
MRELAAQIVGQYGRDVKLLPAAAGLEKKLTGAEPGLVEARVTFQEDRGTSLQAGHLEGTRGAGDVARARARGLTANVPAASIAFEPTERTRLLDGSTTYAVTLVTPRHFGAELVSYNLLLRPL